MKIKNISARTTTSIAVWYIPSLLVTGWLLFQTYDTMWWLASLAVYFLTSCFGITITFSGSILVFAITSCLCHSDTVIIYAILFKNL